MKFRILHYQTIDSTNNLARALALEGAREGTVIWSDYQTHGRGRFKRRWRSARGKNLLVSIILRPRIKADSASILTHVAARAVQNALMSRFGLRTTLKRPNDVMVGAKKIAGILTESSSSGRRIEYVVLGVGLNVNGRRPGIPRRATSIVAEVGRRAEIRDILKDLLVSFSESYKMVR